MPFDLNSMDEKEIESLISEASKVLEQRKAERRQKAIDAAREALAAEGLTFSDVAREPQQRKRERVPGAKPGQKFVNPDNPSQVWTVGRGRPPKWVTERQAQGTMPQAQGAE